MIFVLMILSERNFFRSNDLFPMEKVRNETVRASQSVNDHWTSHYVNVNQKNKS